MRVRMCVCWEGGRAAGRTSGTDQLLTKVLDELVASHQPVAVGINAGEKQLEIGLIELARHGDAQVPRHVRHSHLGIVGRVHVEE